MPELTNYQYRGARALVLMHEHFLEDFVDMWWTAKSAEIELPKTEDQDYQSLDHVLVHVLGAARGYLTWMCEKLGLPDPGIEPAPSVDEVEDGSDEYLEHLLERWRDPLAAVAETRMGEVYESRWGVPMAIESMLEHAVMHPLRHSFQLEELIMEQAPEFLE